MCALALPTFAAAQEHRDEHHPPGRPAPGRPGVGRPVVVPHGGPVVHGGPDPTVAVHNGRAVKRTGDGSLIEFRSVVDAVRCAIEVQNGMVERNAGLPPERRIEFRVGIHLGDVVEESGDQGKEMHAHNGHLEPPLLFGDPAPLIGNSLIKTDHL